MNAPVTSLTYEPSISNAGRLGKFAASKAQAAHAPSSARRSADLFEQLLSLPSVASSPKPTEPLAREETNSSLPPTSEVSSSDDSSEQAVGNDENEERGQEEELTDEISISADAAAAALAASDLLANSTTTTPVTEAADALHATTAEDALVGAESELEVTTTAQIPEDSSIAAEHKLSEQASNSTKDDVSNSSDERSSITSVDADSKLVSADEVAPVEDLVEQDLAPEVSELVAADSENTKEVVDAKTGPGQADSQNVKNPPTTEPSSTPDRHSRGDRKVGRDKWYERDAKESADKEVDSLELESAQPNDRDPSVLGPSGEQTIEATQQAEANNSELAPFVVETAPSPVPSVVGDSILVGAGLTSDVLSISSSSISSEVDLPEGAFTTTATSSNRSGSSVDGQSPTTQPGDAIDLTQQEKIRLIQRVTRSFSRLGVDGGQINLRLHPPQLGSLNVQVRLEGRSMTAKLTTETSAAREVILESLPVLKNRLAEQGFEISQFQVDVATNDNADAAFGEQAQERAYDRDAYRQSQHRFENDPRRTARVHGNQGNTVSLNQLGSDPSYWQPGDGIDVQA